MASSSSDSDFSIACDALIDDLTTNIPGLRDALPHRYAAWDPEQQVAEAGERHLAVWPIADDPDTPIPLVTGPGGDILDQRYAVVYWEHAGDESSRGLLDEEAAKAVLALYAAVRGRLYSLANYTTPIAGSKTRYAGGRFPERSSSVRWFAIAVGVVNTIDVT